MRLAFVRRALIATATLTLLTIPVVSAETVDADRDIVTPGPQTTFEAGTVQPSEVVGFNVYFVLTCTGTSHVDSTQNVKLTLTTKVFPLGGGYTMDTNFLFGLSSAWPADGETCPAGLTSTGGPFPFTVKAPSVPGDYTYRFGWTRSVTPVGNDDSHAFGGTAPSITVNLTVAGSQNTPPALVLPADLTVNGNTTGGAHVTYSATATDAEDASAPVVICDQESGAVFPIGTTTVHCSATDSGGLTTTGSFHVTVQDTAPTLNLPADMIVEGNTSGGAHVTYAATATDVEDAATPAVTCAPASGAVFPLGDTTVDCSTTDGNGVTTNGSFAVTVQDTTAPKLGGVPTDITMTTSDPSGATITYIDPTATDAVDDTPSVDCSPVSGSKVSVGDSTVTCTATDDSGNSSSATFQVHVRLAQASWEDPAAGGLVVNGARTVPIKVGLMLDGQPITTGPVNVSVVPCGGGPAVQTDNLDLQSNGRWMGHLSTDGLANGCYQVIASAGGVAIGSFRMDVHPAATPPAGPNSKTPSPKK